MQTTAIRPTMSSENIATRQKPTPSDAISSRSRVGRKIPSSQVITNRATRNRIRLACRYQPESSAGTPTMSCAYRIVNVHAQTCAPTLKN